jgi:predicted amidophosphoribosyltransferase
MPNGFVLDPEPPGFGLCGRCPYRETAPPALCFACARKTIRDLATERCLVCDLPFNPGEQKCQNILCGRVPRYFDWNYAVAMRTGVLQKAINQYKFDNRKGWALIFARVLVGFLEEERKLFKEFDLIVASPTYVSPEGDNRHWNHTRLVIVKAYEECYGEWPFDVGEDGPAIIKTAKTPRMTGRGWKERNDVAVNYLRPALSIPNPAMTRGKAILVYDDVFTCGHSLYEVARCLTLSGGARRVCGVSLARQPWGH